jgi:hypothetical protein
MVEKQKARELFNEFYMILFEYENISEECLISIIAKKCALLTANELERNSLCPTTKKLWQNVINEIKKI